MRKNLSLALIISSIAVLVPWLLVQYTCHYFVIRASYGIDGIALWTGIVGGRFLRLVLPLALVFSAVQALATAPLQKAYARALAGRTPEGGEAATLVRMVYNLPILVISLTTVPILLGGLMLAASSPVRYPPFSASFWIYLLCNLTAGLSLGYFTTFIQGLTLSRALSVFGIRYLEPYSRWRGLRRRRKLISLAAFIVFTSTTFSIFMNDLTVQESSRARLEAARAPDGSLPEEAASAYREGARSHIGLEGLEVPLPRGKDPGLQGKTAAVSLIALAGFILLGAPYLIFLFKDADGQIGSATAVVRSILEGSADLSARLSLTSDDGGGELVDAVNRLMDHIQGLILSIRDTTAEADDRSSSFTLEVKEVVADIEESGGLMEGLKGQAAAQEAQCGTAEDRLTLMLESFEAIAEGIRNQSAIVSQTAQAARDLKEGIDAADAMAGRADELTGLLSSTSREVGAAVGQAIASIRGIEEHSRKVQEIIGLISKTASQINLLSMNAAIEAAHAGDSGAGFAVVAQEVRALAESSARGATDVRNQVKAMIAKVEDGVKTAAGAEEALFRVSSGIDDTSTFIEVISSAMRDQVGRSERIFGVVEPLVKAAEASVAALDEQGRASVQMRETMRALREASVSLRSNAEEETARGEILRERLGRLRRGLEESRRAFDRLRESVAGFRTG